MSILRVKVTPQQPSLEGKDSLDINIPSSSINILQIKTLIRVKLGLDQDKQVRLIYQGKLLNDNETSLDSLNFNLSEQYLHAVISNAPTPTPSSRPTPTAPATFPLPSSTPTAIPSSNLSGLNRLGCPRFMGELGLPAFPQEAIQQLRVEFQSEIDALQNRMNESRRASQPTSSQLPDDEEAGDNVPLLPASAQITNSNTLVTREEAEDQWLNQRIPSLRLTSIIFADALQDEQRDGIRNPSLTSYLFNGRDGSNDINGRVFMGNHTVSRGQYIDFLYGVFLGYFFGFLLIFCLFDRSISPRLKSGIYVGIIFQIVSNIAFSYSTSNSSNSNHSDSGSSNLRGADSNLRPLY